MLKIAFQCVLYPAVKKLIPAISFKELRHEGSFLFSKYHSQFYVEFFIIHFNYFPSQIRVGSNLDYRLRT